ncbi:hypothetical protein PU560_04545 [Georgenia sp. 10Sc9-8]|uniref:Uncharacterized protein n=1 Tax=Georgenia halotolerans TaxID=3028317 RepID=A0ABT5TXY5_9MICO|nr:hypothetical protein [Georgenia halotolerans]
MLVYYEAGLAHGFDLGYRAAQRAEEARWAAIAATIHQTARAEPYDQLCERRGEPDRAQTQRHILNDRDIW